MSKQDNAEAVSTDLQKGSFEVFSNNRPATQPVPPPAGDQVAPQYNPLDHQAAPQEERLSNDIGIGWKLFIIGFFLGAIPWYIGVIIVLCSRIDSREKNGYIACTSAAFIATIAIIIRATRGPHDWD